MRSEVMRLLAAAILAIAIAAPTFAQNVSVLNAPPATRQETTGVGAEAVTRVFPINETPTRIAVPVAVSADLGGEGQKGVAPTIGFQVFQRDRFFLGAFFTLAANDSTVKEDYGGFVLNPPLEGRSFHIAGNRTWGFGAKDDNSPSIVLLGLGGRWGTTSSQFEFTPQGGTATTVSGFGTFASITAQVMTPSMKVPLGDGNSDNEFQLGVELGPTWRSLGGDVGEDDAFRQNLLGTTKSTFTGFEMTFFVRVNSVQPFARFSTFSRPDDVAIKGFTGRQVVWGVNVASALFNATKP